jgi:hypothetical protein
MSTFYIEGDKLPLITCNYLSIELTSQVPCARRNQLSSTSS